LIVVVVVVVPVDVVVVVLVPIVGDQAYQIVGGQKHGEESKGVETAP
jgi:hypothetical protein